MKHAPIAVCLAALLAAVLSVAPGCKRNKPANGGAPTTAAAAAPIPETPEEPRVVLYTFSEYVPTDVTDDFTKETGIKVDAVTFASNEELFGKLKNDSFFEADVVSPSDYMVRRLHAQNLVRTLDRARLTNFSHLDSARLGQWFDPANAVSVPFFWGVTGIGYNKKKVTDPVDSWAILFDAKYKGQVLMMDDAREVLAAALRKLGKSPNEQDPAVLRQAEAELKKQHSLVRVYDSDTFYDVLDKGEVWLAQGLNGQFAKVIKAKPDELGFAVPKEGATVWMDNLAVPTASKRPKNAHKLIDFLMRPEIAARVADYAAYATPNKTALPKVKAELRNDPIIYPPADVLARCAPLTELGPEANKVVDGLMGRVKQGE